MSPIGLLGGTFDPVHYGHLRAAEELCEALELARVHLLPCRPGHRHPPVAAEAERLAMLRLAAAGNPRLVVDDRDLRRAGPTYSVDTLTELRAEFPDRPLALLMGLDAFLGLPTWKHWRQLTELAHLVVAHRPGAHPAVPAELKDFLAGRETRDAKALAAAPAGSVLLAPLTALDISATRIRELLAAGRSPRYLLPDSVLDRIARLGLYPRKSSQPPTADA